MAPEKSTFLDNPSSVNSIPDSSEDEFVLQSFLSQKQLLDGAANGGSDEENDDTTGEESKKSL
jgi:hypothetical protein